MTPATTTHSLPTTSLPWLRGVHAALLLLTVATTTQAGALHYLGFVTGFAAEPPAISWVSLAAHGLWYSVTLLAILGCHELGHYYACRYYDIDASRPYFLPMPFLLTGTLGAFIRIREPITTKRALFDIGIAGPIAGFVVAVPALLVGMHLSTVARVPDSFQGDLYELGEPLLRALLAQNFRVRALNRAHPTLEDVFLAATRRSWDVVSCGAAP